MIKPVVPTPVAPAAPVAPVVPTAAVQPGVVIPPVAQGDVTPFVANPGEANISTATAKYEDHVAAIYYIAGQRNYVIEHVIYGKVASEKYKKLREKELEKPEDKRVMEADKLDADFKPTGTPTQFTKEYSQAKFRTFCPDAYKEVAAANYMKIVLAEAKPEFIVLKNLLDKDKVEEHEYVSLNEKLSQNAAASNIEKGIFVIRRKTLVAFMVATVAKYVPILCAGNTDVTHPNGRIITTSKEGKNGPNYDLVYIKRNMETAMSQQVKTLIEIGMEYAINKDQTENAGVITDVSKVVNSAQVEALYGPKFNYKAVGTRKSLKKADFADDAAYEKAKEACVIKFGGKGLGKRFEEIGLTAEDVAAFRSKKSRSTSSGPSLDDLYKDHYAILRNYKPNRK